MHALRARLPGGRWHFSHGPIDLILLADGEQRAVEAAHEAAWERFGGLLPELVAELPELRRPVGSRCMLQGPVARRMWRACSPLSRHALTSMAAVAGAVADEIMTHYRVPGMARAWVNNGGDIALHLAPGTRTRIALCADPGRRWTPGRARFEGETDIDAGMPIRGVATSGWRGRSFSLGIADSVPVLAGDAAAADAAATVIANAVDIDDAAIVRRPACAIKDDSDLGERLVTVQVPRLPEAAVGEALDAGQAMAEELVRHGAIVGAALICQGQGRLAGRMPSRSRAPAPVEAGGAMA